MKARASIDRFTAENPCPICGGDPSIPQGQGRRCAGFLSSDGTTAHCTREQFAGSLVLNTTSPPTYAHRLHGACGCGTQHDKQPAPAGTRKWDLIDATGKIVATHWRKDDGKGNKHMWWETNGTKGLNGLPEAQLPIYNLPALLAAEPGATVIVTEGERACDALTTRGLLAVGIAIGAPKVPCDDSLKPLLGYGVAVWPDNDQVGRAQSAEIVARLRAMGHAARTVHWANAPHKGDAADFVGTAAELQSLVDAARASGPALQRTWTVAELITVAEADPPAMLIDPFLAKGDRITVYGYAGIGKSLFILDLSFSLHLGRPFLGHFAVTKARVGYIDEESAAPRLGQRLAMLARGYDVDAAAADLPLFHVQAQDRLDTEDGVAAMFAFVKEYDLDVVAVDTLRRVHQLRENESDDMARIEVAVKTLQRRSHEELERPLTVVLIHHSPKPRSGGGGSAPETMARGSSDIVGWVDGALYLHARDGDIQVDHAKARWTEPMQPFLVRINATSTALSIKHVGVVPTKRKRGEEIREWIATALADADDRQLTQTDILKAAEDAGFSNDKAIRTVLKQMVDDGDLAEQRSGKFKVYRLVWSTADEARF